MDYIQTGKDNFMHTYAQLDVCFDRGKGCGLYDTNGKKYLDLVGGIAVNALGYGNEKLIATAEKVMKEGIFHVSNLYYNKYTVMAAERLNRAAGSDRVFFANSGAEANEAALKLARKYGYPTGRTKVLSFEHSFHGRTYGAITLTGQEKYHKGFAPMVPDIEYATYNDLESVKAKIDDSYIAVIVEPVQGEGGIIPADPVFLQGLRQLCDEKDMLLIYDCVQCGMGRTGRLFAWQHYGVRPDLMSLAKALGGGLPLSALCGYGKASDIFTPGDHASTFGGNPVASALAVTVLDELEGGLADSVLAKGEHLRAKLEELKVKYPQVCTDVRGLGLMMGVEVTLPPASIIAKCREKGVILCSAGYDVVRFVPPLVITEEEIDIAVSVLDEAIAESLN